MAKSVKYGNFEIPFFGLGTWQISENDLEAALNAALQAGYRLFDTAASYGNEHVIGGVLKSWVSSGKIKRADLFVITKLPVQGVNPDRVEHFIKMSLEKLQLNYVDLYLVNFPFGAEYTEGADLTGADIDKLQPEWDTDLLAVWKKMEDQVNAGRCKYIGVSNFSMSQIEKILKSSKIKPVCLQTEIQLYCQQKQLVDFCQKNNMAVIAYGTLGSPAYKSFMQSIGVKTKDELPSILKHPSVIKIAEKYKKTTAQVILRFFIQKNIVVIPKSAKADRVKENFQVWDINLDKGDMDVLENLEKGEDGRTFDYKTIFSQFIGHPEFHFG